MMMLKSLKRKCRKVRWWANGRRRNWIISRSWLRHRRRRIRGRNYSTNSLKCNSKSTRCQLKSVPPTKSPAPPPPITPMISSSHLSQLLNQMFNSISETVIVFTQMLIDLMDIIKIINELGVVGWLGDKEKTKEF